jgi:hypothetical protein
MELPAAQPKMLHNRRGDGMPLVFGQGPPKPSDRRPRQRKPYVEGEVILDRPSSQPFSGIAPEWPRGESAAAVESVPGLVCSVEGQRDRA